ncbi:Variant surface glycoprotein [Trypanosoma congolense IL3000]|uniref:Variant surface glycoprotein n=1 Tax=Trypanosoma congolense (strain IL3000) TaxID=1068625 RepID=F9WDU9_TRYCI|nr:Variant surface glycoprotein [Trypanosoma congolense IL3000]
MWRRVPLFLFLVVIGLCSSENNENVFLKLCHIAGNVSALMGKENGEAKISLEQALYGKDGIASFGEDGSVLTVYGCGLGNDMRPQLCSHKVGEARLSGLGQPGCFADSLFGTFLCLCVPGGDKSDLCGLGNDVTGIGVWSGGWNSGVTPGLLKRVWDKIKNRCFKHITTTEDTSGHLEDLKNSVDKIKEETKQKKFSNGHGGYYLGGNSTNGHCRGDQPQDGCVTYPDKSGNPDIPWADKILEGLKKLNETRTHQKASSQNSAQAGHQDHEDHSDHASEETDDDHEDDEGEEESVHNSTPQDPPNKPRSKRKRRSTKKQPTEQPVEPLKAILHDDSSFLPQPFWLLSAVVI